MEAGIGVSAIFRLQREKEEQQKQREEEEHHGALEEKRWKLANCCLSTAAGIGYAIATDATLPSYFHQ
eukprot:COSAG03_NODE_15255_length_436_cov_1.216617_1_plen_67_part_01